MYMRLAFAVAAHLEPEILLIDEVLAVGDADFQKKCLGKMGDVANAGRTVLFVSHNRQQYSRYAKRRCNWSPVISCRLAIRNRWFQRILQVQGKSPQQWCGAMNQRREMKKLG